MALSFAEKRDIQKNIKICIADLDNNPDFKTKRTLQKQLAEAFARLEGKIPETQKSLVDQFLAGKFIREAPNKFFSIFMKVYGMVQGNLDDLKKPIMEYIRANKPDAITESAFSLQSGKTSISLAELQQLISSMAASGKTSFTINIE